MPIHRMLKGATFDAKAVPILLEVFDESVADLDLQTPEDRENVAKIIVRLAHGQATVDATKLRIEVMRLMRKERAGDRRPF